MENDQIFEADAAIESVDGVSKDKRNDLGKNTMILSEGGIDTSFRSGRYTEDSLLLGDNRSESEVSTNEQRDDEWAAESDFAGLPWWHRPSIYWLLPSFLIFALAFGGILVPKLNLILTLICREYMSDKAVEDPSFSFMPVLMGEDNPQCQIPEVSARTAQFTLAGTLISGCIAAVVSPKLGALSDRYGRKPILMYGSFGMFVTELLTICAANYPETFHVSWLLVGFFFDGLCGSFIAPMAISSSYAADCTPPQQRNVAFGYFQGCLFTGVALGPIIAAYIIKVSGTVVTMFYIALAVHTFFFLFLVLILPESLSKRRQLAAREKYRLEQEELQPTADWINQLRSFNLFAPLKILYPTGSNANAAVRRNLVLLAATDTIMFGVAMGALSVIVIYSNYEFGWGNFESSRFLSIVNICRVSCLLVLLPLLTRIIKGPASRRAQQRPTGSDKFEINVIRLAVCFDMLGFVGYSVARDGVLFTLSGAVASAGGIGSPTLQAALTKHVSNDKIGQLLGATGLLHALARVFGPLVFSGIYSATVGKFDQAVFVCLAGTFGIAFICSWFIRPHIHLDDPLPDETGEDLQQHRRGESSESQRETYWHQGGKGYGSAVTGFFKRWSPAPSGGRD